MRRPGAAELVAVLEVPVVGRAQGLRVRQRRRPADERACLLDRDVRVLVCGPVVPLGERREARKLEARGARPRPVAQAPPGAAIPSPRAARGPRGPRAPSRTGPRRCSAPRLRPMRRSTGRPPPPGPRRRAAGSDSSRRRGSGSGGPRGSSRTGSRTRRAARGRRTSWAGRSPPRARVVRTLRRAAPPRSWRPRSAPRPRAGRPRGSDVALGRRRRPSTTREPLDGRRLRARPRG